MAKWQDIAESEKIGMIKDSLIRGIEEMLLNGAEIKKMMSESDFKQVSEFMPQLKVEGCNCGCCINIGMLESRIPRELQPLVVVAKKRCEAATY